MIFILAVETLFRCESESALFGLPNENKLFFYRPIVSLDNTLIHHLVSFITLWSCTKTVIFTFKLLESIAVQYMDTNPGMFSSKTLVSFWLKKEIHKHLGWHDIVNYKDILIWKWTNPWNVKCCFDNYSWYIYIYIYYTINVEVYFISNYYYYFLLTYNPGYECILKYMNHIALHIMFTYIYTYIYRLHV